jgi:hypothetical protein
MALSDAESISLGTEGQVNPLLQMLSKPVRGKDRHPAVWLQLLPCTV